MMREFIAKMRDEGLVIDINEPCSPDMQAAKMAAGTDKILFFHNLGGSRAVMNLTADRHALSLSLDLNEKDMVQNLAHATFEGTYSPGRNICDEKAGSFLYPGHALFPKRCREILHCRALSSRNGMVWKTRPSTVCWFLTITVLPPGLVEGRHTHVMLKRALACGERLPIAVAIGVHPAVTFASCTRVPDGKELSYAAELLGGDTPGKRVQ